MEDSDVEKLLKHCIAAIVPITISGAASNEECLSDQEVSASFD